jgi:calcineurin-like phosphoesterase family protein
MSKIYITSDTHYGHKNIVRGTSEWTDKSRCRPFDSIEEHNAVLVENINRTVGENDILYHLGDWSFGGADNIRLFRSKLRCKTIHLILGNHDHHIERNTNGSQYYFSSVQHYKETVINKQRIVMSHFAMRVWNKSHHGSYMLYGHSHGTLDDKKPIFPQPTWIGDEFYIKNSRSMDVGVDCHPEFRPFSIDEIHDILRNREVTLNIDHHNENTN